MTDRRHIVVAKMLTDLGYKSVGWNGPSEWFVGHEQRVEVFLPTSLMHDVNRTDLRVYCAQTEKTCYLDDDTTEKQIESEIWRVITGASK